MRIGSIWNITLSFTANLRLMARVPKLNCSAKRLERQVEHFSSNGKPMDIKQIVTRFRFQVPLAAYDYRGVSVL